jgi:hypothetical protein
VVTHRGLKPISEACFPSPYAVTICWSTVEEKSRSALGGQAAVAGLIPRLGGHQFNSRADAIRVARATQWPLGL